MKIKIFMGMSIFFVMIFTGVNMGLAEPTAPTGKIDSLEVFYNGVNYEPSIVREALSAHANLMQNLMGRPSVNTEIYDGREIESQKRTGKLEGFYDPDTDTIFVNLAIVDLNNTSAYRKLIDKLSELRFDATNENPQESDRWTKFRAAAFSNETDINRKNKGNSGKKKMGEWLSENKMSPTLTEGTAKALKVISPLDPTMKNIPSGKPKSSTPVDDDTIQTQLLEGGRKSLNSGKPGDAITQYFDKAILNFEAKYGNRKERIYCARTPSERLTYLAQAAKDNREAIVLDAVWSYAYYLKGYALIELKRVPEGQRFIEQALIYSPANSQILSELGFIYQTAKNYPKSLELFGAAVDGAAFSPEKSKVMDLGRARRGAGYALVELGQLDKAEEEYRQCLEVNPNDKQAKVEIEYIRRLKNKTIV